MSGAESIQESEKKMGDNKRVKDPGNVYSLDMAVRRASQVLKSVALGRSGQNENESSSTSTSTAEEGAKGADGGK